MPTRTVWIILIVALGALLRLYQLGAWDLGLDEGFSANVAGKSVRAIWAFIAQEDPVHPPLFYLLLHFWRALGTGEFVLRLLPVIFGVLSIILLFRIGQYLVDGRTGLLAAFILAVSPFHIWYSQELRMYEPLFFLSLASLDALVRLIREGRLSQWLAYVTFATLSVYTDYGALLVLAAHNIAVAALMALGKGPRLRKWVVAQAAIIVLYLPWIGVLLEVAQAAGEMMQGRGLMPAGLDELAFTVAAFTSAFLPMGRPLIKIVVILVFGSVFLFGIWTHRRSLPVWLIPGSLAVAPLLIGAALSFVTRVFFVRMLTPASAGYYLLMAAGFLALPRRVGSLMVAGLVGVNLFSLNIMFHHTEKSAPWSTIAGHVAAQIQPGEGIAFVAGHWQRVFDFYYRPDGTPKEGYTSPADLGRVQAFVDRHQGLFVVLKEETKNDPRRRVRSYILSRLSLVARTEFPGGVVVERYSRPPGAPPP